MNFTVFARRAAAGAVAVVAASTLSVTPAQAVVGWGAIAYARDGSSAGYSENYPSASEAGEAATEVCGAASCKVVNQFTDCGVVARSESSQKYAAAHAASLSRAEARALKALGGDDGYIEVWACND